VERLPEERLDALEAERDDLPEVSGGVIEPRAHHGADTDVQELVWHRLTSSEGYGDALAALGALDRAEHHRKAFDVVGAVGLRPRAIADRCNEILDDAEVSANAVGGIERRHVDRLDLVEEALA